MQLKQHNQALMYSASSMSKTMTMARYLCKLTKNFGGAALNVVVELLVVIRLGI